MKWLPSIVLLSQQPKKQFLVSTCQKADYDAIVGTRKKGIPGDCQNCKSLGIPYFKPVSVLYSLFRDKRHTVSTWVETMALMSTVHGNKSYADVRGNKSGLCSDRWGDRASRICRGSSQPPFWYNETIAPPNAPPPSGLRLGYSSFYEGLQSSLFYHQKKRYQRARVNISFFLL